MLQIISSNSDSLVQLQALQQVLAWLLQLPVRQGREVASDVLRQSNGWLQQLLKCWAAEVSETGCSVQQAAAVATERYATAYGGEAAACSQAAAAAAVGGIRGVGGYVAGLCQLLLQLLGACCKEATAKNGDDVAPNSAVLPEGGLLQQLAANLKGLMQCCCPTQTALLGTSTSSSSSATRMLVCGAVPCLCTCSAARLERECWNMLCST
jgi:hypothetical protein